MNRKYAMIIGLQAFLIIVLFWLLVFYGKDEYEATTKDSEEQIQASNRVASKQGQTIITIGTATQAQSEIKTSPLKASIHSTSIMSYGNVVAIDSLIELRTRYFVAKADAQVLSAGAARNRSEYARLHTLNLDDKNVSDKVVTAALADVRADEAKIIGLEASSKSIQDTMQQAWGEALTRLAIGKDDSGLLQNLIHSNEVLIQITLPFDAPEPIANSHIAVSPSASPATIINAVYLSRAPINNGAIQGKTYFYHAKSNTLRAGMQIRAEFKSAAMTSKNNTNGVVIPSDAVVWYAAKPWVYRKISGNQFSRSPINTDVEIENGWFQQGNFKAGDEVVTNGAQLLLSEEFKSQITNENDD